MNILFLTLANIADFEENQNIYADQCREFVRRGNRVHIVCPDESGNDTRFMPYGEGSGLLRVKTGQIQKTGLLRKGISMLTLSTHFKSAIKKYLMNTKYDMVIYSTPPITLVSIIKYIKKRDGAKTYLLLKDIFPQNAVDLGMMCKSGLKAPIYWYFRHMERKLYAVSDRIGCMSQANVDYIKTHEPQIPPENLHISPNSFDPETICIPAEEKRKLRKEYGLPVDKKIFIYGGNIGQPQGVDHIISCMKAVAHMEDCFFVICGNGTEYRKLDAYVQVSGQANLLLLPGLPREKYEEFLGCFDVGLIFLDHRFTIPNFPSRLLSYMRKTMPVIACTDPVSDVGTVIEEGQFGLWCESDDPEKFVHAVERLCKQDLSVLGENAANYLKAHYNTQKVANIILNGEQR